MGWPCDYTRALSESPGVDLSSCEVNGDPHNRECLPILPAGCTSLYSSIVDSQTSRQDTQAQSPFFTDLLPQIRQLIYICLFGNRRTHLEFDCRSKQARWLWWHRVCDSPDKCPDKEFICPENATAEAMMLHLGSKPREMEGTEAKVDGIGWFSCSIDQIPRVSRVMPRDHLSLLIALVVEIDVYRISLSFRGMTTEFAKFYLEFFGVFQGIMSGLSRLSLSISGLPRSPALIEWSNEDEGMWKVERLEIAVPASWYSAFEAVIGRRGQLCNNKRFSLKRELEPFRRRW
ncbi:hypothetical protein BJY01DRAFT_263495 [Aspergillus pseudoustus]|uniref:Uncharacterized protein n=1 Tax=Aspergillus pseudoustus TaxID=1810923 RepID=A0ABR4KVW7_9EURO